MLKAFRERRLIFTGRRNLADANRRSLPRRLDEDGEPEDAFEIGEGRPVVLVNGDRTCGCQPRLLQQPLGDVLVQCCSRTEECRIRQAVPARLRPALAPSRPRRAGHAGQETGYRSSAGRGQLSPDGIAIIRPRPPGTRQTLRAALRRRQLTVFEGAQEPFSSRVTKTGTASYLAGGKARITFVAESTETSCSAERPPKSTAMLQFRRAPRRRSLTISGMVLSWQDLEAGRNAAIGEKTVEGGKWQCHLRSFRLKCGKVGPRPPAGGSKPTSLQMPFRCVIRSPPPCPAGAGNGGIIPSFAGYSKL